jgi:hypothetical protein
LVKSEQLSAKELHAILKVCRKNGVTKIAMRGFSVELLPESERIVAATSRSAVRAVSEVDEVTQKQLDSARKADELALLAIEDPVAYEKHLLSENADQEDDPNEIELDV